MSMKLANPYFDQYESLLMYCDLRLLIDQTYCLLC